MNRNERVNCDQIKLKSFQLIVYVMWSLFVCTRQNFNNKLCPSMTTFWMKKNNRKKKRRWIDLTIANLNELEKKKSKLIKWTFKWTFFVAFCCQLHIFFFFFSTACCQRAEKREFHSRPSVDKFIIYLCIFLSLMHERSKKIRRKN